MTVRLVFFMLLPGFRTVHLPGLPGICCFVLCICFLVTRLGYHLHCRCVASLHCTQLLSLEKGIDTVRLIPLPLQEACMF